MNQTVKLKFKSRHHLWRKQQQQQQKRGQKLSEVKARTSLKPDYRLQCTRCWFAGGTLSSDRE